MYLSGVKGLFFLRGEEGTRESKSCGLIDLEPNWGCKLIGRFFLPGGPFAAKANVQR